MSDDVETVSVPVAASFGSTDVVRVASGEEVTVTRDVSGEMSMDQLAGWMEETFGKTGVQAAMRQAAFMLCVDVISQDIAKSTLRFKQLLPDGTSKIVPPQDHPIAEMLALEPNRRHTWYEYTEMQMIWLCMESNNLAYIVRNNVGDPIELVPIQPGRWREMISGRETFYEITASTMHEQALLGASMIRAPERDVIHVRMRNMDGLDGYSTMSAGSDTLKTGATMHDYQEKLLSEDGQMRGVFTKDGPGVLPQEAFDRLRSQFRTLMNRFRTLTEPVVLESGIKFQTISSNPKDMEFASQMSAHISNVCRLMRVPPHKVFQMDGSKYDNLETSEKIYVGDTLVPRCVPTEQRLARQLLSKKDRLKFFFEFDRDQMTLRDSARENERLKTIVERGLIEIDEARAEMGYNPLPNGQGKVRIIPANMVVVDRDGKVVIGSLPSPASDTAEAEPKAAETEAEPAADVPVAANDKQLRLVK